MNHEQLDDLKWAFVALKDKVEAIIKLLDELLDKADDQANTQEVMGEQ